MKIAIQCKNHYGILNVDHVASWENHTRFEIENQIISNEKLILNTIREREKDKNRILYESIGDDFLEQRAFATGKSNKHMMTELNVAPAHRLIVDLIIE